MVRACTGHCTATPIPLSRCIRVLWPQCSSRRVPLLPETCHPWGTLRNLSSLAALLQEHLCEQRSYSAAPHVAHLALHSPRCASLRAADAPAALQSALLVLLIALISKCCDSRKQGMLWRCNLSSSCGSPCAGADSAASGPAVLPFNRSAAEDAEGRSPRATAPLPPPSSPASQGCTPGEAQRALPADSSAKGRCRQEGHGCASCVGPPMVDWACRRPRHHPRLAPPPLLRTSSLPRRRQQRRVARRAVQQRSRRGGGVRTHPGPPSCASWWPRRRGCLARARGAAAGGSGCPPPPPPPPSGRAPARAPGWAQAPA